MGRKKEPDGQQLSFSMKRVDDCKELSTDGNGDQIDQEDGSLAFVEDFGIDSDQKCNGKNQEGNNKGG